jgi:PAS domain S-box-containing protein
VVYHETEPVEVWAENSFYPIYESGLVVGTACFSRNITARKKEEEGIRKSNDRFEIVASATNDIIWDWDLVTGSLWWNRNYYIHFGFDLKSTAPDINSRYQHIHAEDRERVLSGISMAFANSRHFWTDEYRFHKNDGQTAFILDCGYILYDIEKKPYRMVGAMLDITSRKNAESLIRKSLEEKQALAARMAAILNTLPANIALLDEEGRIIDINDSWRHFADNNGYSGNNYGIGENYLAVPHKALGAAEKDGKLVAAGIRAIMEHKTKDFVHEYPCHAPGVKRWYRMIATQLEDKDYTGAVVMHIDISEIRKLEQERLKSKLHEQKRITRAMLQAQEKERSQLGQELHDNISQLLAAIRMKLSLYISTNKSSKPILADCIHHLEEAVTETRNLSHRMLMPRFKESSFVESVQALSKNYNLDNRKVTLDAIHFTEKDISPNVLEALYRIIQEQLHNIEKHAAASNVLISITSNATLATLKIGDNGAGFDTKKKRTGIGLTNIMNRAESFNGHAKINSEPGHGCVLLVEIPVAEK